MAVRPIDAVQVRNDINLHHKPTPVSEFESGFNNGLNQAIWEITHAPTLTQPPITGDTSDGYHTFNELYHHRAILFSVICNERPEVAWKSKRHHDGTMYDGMFIVGIDTPEGQATYHYDIDPYWNLFRVKELKLAPKWDGHTSGEAIRRIGTLTQPNEGGKDKNVPTNEPLTLEELRLMAELTPVWWDWVQGWVLAKKGMIMSWNGRYHNSGELRGDFIAARRRERGNLLEIEKLIERLQNWDGIKPDREIDCAIEGLKALQAENDRLRREKDDAIRQLKFFAPCAGCKWYRGIKGCAHELGCDTNHDYYEFVAKEE